MAEGIKAARVCLAELNSILIPSFGPWGKDVLMKSNTGTIYITKNGLSILKQLEIKHPIGSMIQNSIKNYSNLTGDFSKSFVTILWYLIDAIFTKYVDTKTWRSAEKLQTILSMISKSLINIRMLLSHENMEKYLKNKLLQCTHTELFDKYFNGLFRTYICNQFNNDTSNTIKKLVKDMFKMVSISKESTEYLVRHFHSICIKVHGLPISFSRIVEGVIIQRESVPRNVDKGVCRFILLSGKLSRAGNDLTLKLIEDSLSHQERALKKFYSVIIETLVSQNITLIFTEEAIPKHLELLLIENNITYISFVQDEDLTRLCLLYNISVLSGLYDIYSVQHNQHVVGIARFFKSCVLGTKYCSHLGPPSTIDITSNIQLLLCSTTEGIGIQYVETIHSFLKVLFQCFDRETSSLCFLLPAGGTFEFMLFDYCCNLNLENADSLQSEIVKMIADSLLQIPKSIFKNSGQLSAKRFLFGLNKLKPLGEKKTSTDADSGYLLPSVNGTSGSMVDASLENIFEPLNSKLILLSRVLELCAQIVRIDFIIPVTKNDGLLCDESKDSDSE